MRSVGAVIVVGLAACGYRGGTYRDGLGSFGDTQRTVGCLDVGVQIHHDDRAQGPVLAYAFGNRCDRAAVVDLGAVRVTGRTLGGEEIALVPFDPEQQLRPARLDARRTGREAIEYWGGHGRVRMICADLAALDGAEREQQVVCLDTGVP